jgi:hypothetical protein
MLSLFSQERHEPWPEEELTEKRHGIWPPRHGCSFVALIIAIPALLVTTFIAVWQVIRATASRVCKH